MRRVRFEYDSLLQKQNGQCAICKVDYRKSQLNIDHNHKTLEVRGLLCHECNSGIAYFDENTQYLIHAAIYLLGGASEKPIKITDDRLALDILYDGGVSELRPEAGDNQRVPLSGEALAKRI